jgi:hypothetical protein
LLSPFTLGKDGLKYFGLTVQLNLIKKPLHATNFFLTLLILLQTSLHFLRDLDPMHWWGGAAKSCFKSSIWSCLPEGTPYLCQQMAEQ